MSPSVVKKKFRYSDVEYLVSGDASGSGIPLVDFKKCSQLVSEYVASIAKPVSELPHKQINAFSYYFDRAADIGLIGKIGNLSTLISYYPTFCFQMR